MTETPSRTPESGSHRSGIVAIIGPPNAGKSTLLNTFIGQKLAIVTPKPQTTRTSISGILSEDTAQVLFLDTPGIHHTRQTMNAMMVDVAWKSLESSDSLLLVLDASRYARRQEILARDLSTMQKRLSRLPMPLCIALNKLDLVKDKRELLPLMQSVAGLFPQAEIFPVSAARARHTEGLLEAVKLSLPQAPPLYPQDQLSTLPMRFLAAEIIREKLFFALDKELPYTVAVRIETWSSNPEQGLVKIYATILVPKKSTKGIVIGNKGARLKGIGQQSRLEISQMLECDVYLDLWVKVRSKWTEDRHFLQELLADADPAFPTLE